MAIEETTEETIRGRVGQSLYQIKGKLFEGILLAATLFGILSLAVLLGYMVNDGLKPTTASAEWYLLYFLVFVVPTAGVVEYVRRNPAVKDASLKTTAMLAGGLLGTLTVYVLAEAVSPYDVLIFFVAAAVPPLLVYGYGQRTDEQTYTGPAIPLAVILGVAVGAVVYGVVRPIIGIAAAWIVYYAIVAVPVAAVIGLLVLRRSSVRAGGLAAGGILATTAGLAVALIATGFNPSVWIVLFAGFVVPSGYVLVDTARQSREGRLGVAAPFAVLGSMLVGAVLERQLSVDGLDPFLSPTLITNSWNNLDASQTGVYPQLVGSILVVSVMAVVAFPIGIGAAIYLEEYAPESGLKGRFASLLEVNIANLAGVPSVVYGLLGLALFVRTIGLVPGAVAAAAGTLGLLILPIVIVSTQEALRAVPDELRQASYGAGASRWQTLRNVVFPEALPGTLTGTILALARAIGETAPLVIIAVATTRYSPPSGLFSAATALPLQVFAARSNFDPAFRHGVLPAAAIVLVALMLLMNTTAVVIRNRYSRED